MDGTCSTDGTGPCTDDANCTGMSNNCTKTIGSTCKNSKHESSTGNKERICKTNALNPSESCGTLIENCEAHSGQDGCTSLYQINNSRPAAATADQHEYACVWTPGSGSATGSCGIGAQRCDPGS